MLEVRLPEVREIEQMTISEVTWTSIFVPEMLVPVAVVASGPAGMVSGSIIGCLLKQNA